ncbi:MAG: GAF domain-containing protein [Tunicatimonas sp.]
MESSQENFLNLDQRLAQFAKQHYRSADKSMQFFVLSYFGLGWLLSFYYDTWIYALGIGGANTLAYFISTRWMPGSLVSRMTISVVFAIFMFQFVGQMHGMYEMHFFFFINITILLIYQDWRVLVPYTGLVVVHHGVLFLLQLSGADVQNYIVDVEVMTYTIIVFHLGLAAFMALVCGWWAMRLQKRAIEDFKNKVIAEQQVARMEHNVAFAGEITEGNLDVPYELSEDDNLGHSLFKMRQSLLEARTKEQQERFINTGLAEVGVILRSSSENLDEIAQQTISYIVNYLKINQGGMFILQNDEEAPYLSLSACYAFERKKHLKRRVALGEGLVGQVVLEKSTVHLTNVPSDYINITSGLGEANPRSVLIIPLKSSETVVGVMEFAAFSQFEPFEIEFLEKLAESIAASVIAIQTNHQTKKLLEQAQENEENLRAQEEEMRQNMEELQATQEEADRKVKAYKDLLRQKEEEIAQVKEQA